MPELTDGTPVLPDSVRSLRPTYRSGKDLCWDVTFLRLASQSAQDIGE